MIRVVRVGGRLDPERLPGRSPTTDCRKLTHHGAARVATVSATTGAIMMTIKADMYHHCGPRVPFCAATRIGMVWALAVERKSARRYSFQARIRTSSAVAISPGLASGRTIWKKIR